MAAKTIFLAAFLLTNGEIVQALNYDEFGNVLTNSGNELIPFRFSGGLTDEHTGLIRFGARDYSPEIGRWVSKDPIGFAGGVSNLYEYCLNDPVNYADIGGHQPMKNWIYNHPGNAKMANDLENISRNIGNKASSTAKELNQSVYANLPIALDMGAAIAIYAGQPWVGLGIGMLSASITLEQGNSFDATLGFAATASSAAFSDWRIQLAIALGQVGYNALPDDLLPNDISVIIPNMSIKPANNPFAVPDNTYVKINLNSLKNYEMISCH